MNEDQFIQLIQKYSEGNCSEEEVALLESWYNNYAMKEKVQISEEDLFKNRNLIWKGLQEENEEQVEAIILPRAKRNKLLWYKVGAAAAILIVSFLMYIYYPPAVDVTGQSNIAGITPPQDTVNAGVLLTLPNGEVVALNEGKEGLQVDKHGLTYIDGAQLSQSSALSLPNASVLSSKEAPEVTLSTPLGKTYKIILADGSQVWLNSGSSLTYPLHFEGVNKRLVSTTGEVYFKVAKDKSKPFVVRSKAFDVEVLGTAFNMQTYEEEKFSEVTLEEGKVAAYVGAERYDLTPDKQLKVNNSNSSVRVLDVQASDISSWRDGYFVFKATSLEALTGLVKRWYQIDLVLADPNVGKIPMSGVVYKDEEITDFMSRLESTANIKWNRKGNKIYIKN